MWSTFPDICLTVEGKSRKKPNQEIDSTGDRAPARCVRSNNVTPWPQHLHTIKDFFITGTVGLLRHLMQI